MSGAAAITVEGLTKAYRTHDSARPAALKELVLGGFRNLRATGRRVALDDVTFSVEQGRSVGLVGGNGAGKSTLLRMLAGVGRPDRGVARVHGRLGAILELGTGFHPDLSGREAAVLAGVIAGMRRADVRGRVGDIASFAELDDVIDEPVRSYSTGMRARLAFSVATHVDPDVLLVDEALAVGDLAFQQRCVDRIRAFRDRGVTVVLVSHDPTLLGELCDEVIWLRAGRVAARGAPRAVTEQYVSHMADLVRAATPPVGPSARTPAGLELRVRENRWGTMRAGIGAVHVLDAAGAPCEQVATGGPVRVSVGLVAPVADGGAQLSVTLVRADGVPCLDACTDLAPGTRSLRLDVERLDLGEGHYRFDVGLYSADWEETFDYHHGAYPLRIVGPRPGSGLMAPPLSWTRASAIDAGGAGDGHPRGGA